VAQTSVTIGTRASDLALWQANAVRRALIEAHGFEEEAVAIRPMTTSGDRIRDRALIEAGGKGLFTKEIEEALLEGDIDIAVHSAKDMPTALPDGLTLAAYLPREDVRDALIGGAAPTLDALPYGATLGTASLRRQALVRRARPDLQVALLRGNVPTRLRRVEEGAFDATLLALAGLKRLGLESHATERLDLDRFPPACGQGAVVVEARARDARVLRLLAAIDCAPTSTALACERAFLAALDGSCRTPIAGHATVEDGMVRFTGLLLSPDGALAIERRAEGAVADAARLGRETGEALRAEAPPSLLAVIGI